VLSQQLQMPHLFPAYEDATGRPHGYLLMDLSLHTPKELRLRSQLFTNLAVHMPPRV
jgi:hypothetical protein